MITYELDVFDSEDPFSEDLTELYDYTSSHGLDFVSELEERILNHLVYMTEDGTLRDFEPILYSSILDFDGYDSYITAEVGELFGEPLRKLLRKLEAIVSWASEAPDANTVLAYAALLDDTGWVYMTIDRQGITDDMTDYIGVFDSKWEVVQQLISDGEMDDIPGWVVVREDDTADEAEASGYFATHEISSWEIAAWR